MGFKDSLHSWYKGTKIGEQLVAVFPNFIICLHDRCYQCFVVDETDYENGNVKLKVVHPNPTL